MTTVSFLPGAMSTMLLGLTERSDIETYGNIIGVATKEGKVITGVVFSRNEEYQDRRAAFAIAVPRGGALQEYLVPAQHHEGICHSHPRMSAYMSGVDIKGFSEYPIGTVSVVIGHETRTFVRTKSGIDSVNHVICWANPKDILAHSRLDWKIPSLVVHPVGLDKTALSLFHQAELQRIAEIKAFSPKESFILYINICNQIVLRVWEMREKSAGELAEWLEELLGYESLGRLRLHYKNSPIPNDRSLLFFEEYSLLDASLEVMR